MKTIVVFSDHSANAVHAGEQAVNLAGKLHANILLAHSYILIPVGDYATVVPIMSNENILLEQESELQLKTEAEHLEQVAAQLPEAYRKPTVHYVQQIGDPGSLATDLCEKHDVELIVLGGSKDSAAEHFFFGSDTRKVLDEANCPILLIPADEELHDIRKVVFATDFDKHDFIALKYLVGLGNIFHFDLVVTHVNTPDKHATHAPEEEFKHKLEGLRYPHISYHEIGGMEVPTRLNSFCRAQKASVLAMGHRQHSLLGRLMHKSMARAAASQQQLPLLIFPVPAKAQ